MADVIEFPARATPPDELPQPGDRYRAYAAASFEPACLTLILADRTMRSYPYRRREGLQFRPRGEDGGGGCVLALMFAVGRGDAAGLRITGRDLREPAVLIGEGRLRWLRELPEGRAVPDEGPVVRSIEVREGDAGNVSAWLSEGG